MIRAFKIDGGGLKATETISEAHWIDLFEPTEAERAEVSALVGLEVPSREDQEEIEQSSRLYMEGKVPVMTVLLPARRAEHATEIMPVTFILTGARMVTIRHHNPRPFESFPPKAGRASLGCHTVERLGLGLLEEIIDRLADITENAGREIEALSQKAFSQEDPASGDLHGMLRQIGGTDVLIMHLRECLLTLERMLGFLAPVVEARELDREVRGMIDSHLRDVRTIAEQASFLTQKTSVLLEATLGLINIQQAAIIKIFSVVAVVFLPPTLIASIYGMNFAYMPELQWRFGYAWALGLMILSAVIPLLWFRRKGWF